MFELRGMICHSFHSHSPSPGVTNSCALQTHNQECIFPPPHRRNRSSLREENQILTERIARMETLLANTTSTKQAMAPSVSLPQHQLPDTVHESPSRIPDPAPSSGTVFSNSIQPEHEMEVQPLLDVPEESVDPMNITHAHENNEYTEFEIPEFQPSLSPSETINKHADVDSLRGSLTKDGSEMKQSINSPQNVGVFSYLSIHCRASGR
jgi:hypothetical protein